MQNLLIVDDEFEIREGLKRYEWESIGIVVSGCCEHGLEALQWIKKHPVDLIITDIRMPVMDGIQLMEKVNRDYPFIKTVILSGYDDFDYIRSALRNGVSDYLLKPVDEKELKAVFTKLISSIDRKMQERDKQSYLEKQNRLFTKALRRNFLNQLLFQPMTEDEINEGGVYGELLLDAGLFVVAKFRLDRLSDKFEFYSMHDWELIVFALDNLLTDMWLDSGEGYYYIDSDTAECYLVATECQGMSKEDVLARFLSVKQELYRFRGLFRSTISIGIGLAVTESIQLVQSQKQAALALQSQTKHDDVKFYEDLGECSLDLSESVRNDGPESRQTESFAKPVASTGHYIIRNAIEFIKQNFDRTITLADVAGVVNMNPTYLSYLFKEVTGENFSIYLTHCRIEKSKQLLKETNYKVYEVAERVGYENTKYFTIIFKKVTGMTPNQFRNQ